MKGSRTRCACVLAGGVLVGLPTVAVDDPITLAQLSRNGIYLIAPAAPVGLKHALTYTSGNDSILRLSGSFEGMATAPEIPLFGGVAYNGILQGQSSASYAGDTLTIRHGFDNGGMPKTQAQARLSDGQFQTIDLDRVGYWTERAHVTRAPDGFNVVSVYRSLSTGQQEIYSQAFLSDGDPGVGGQLTPLTPGQIGSASAGVGLDSLRSVVSQTGNTVVSHSVLPFGSGAPSSGVIYLDTTGPTPAPMKTTTFPATESPQLAFSLDGNELLMGSWALTGGFGPQLHVLETDPSLAPTDGNAYNPLDFPGTGPGIVQPGAVVVGQQVYDWYTTERDGNDDGSLINRRILADGREIGERSLVDHRDDTSFTDLSAAYDYSAHRSEIVYTQFDLNTAASEVRGASLERGGPIVQGDAKVLLWAGGGATSQTLAADAFTSYIEAGGTLTFDEVPGDPGNNWIKMESPGDAMFSWQVDPLTTQNIQEIDDGDDLVMAFDIVVDQAYIDNDAKFEISILNSPLGGGGTVEAAKFTVTGAMLDPILRSAQFVLHFTTTHDVWALNPQTTIMARMLVDDDPIVWLDNLTIWIESGVIPGDTDGDGDIDDTDLGTSFANYTGPVGAVGGKTAADGDTDGDGDVDDTDLGTLFAGYTGPLGPNRGGNVPEPTSLALLGLGGLAMSRRRRA